MSSPDGVDVVGVTEAIAGTTVARRDPVVRHELRVDPSEQHAALFDLARQCDDFDVRMEHLTAGSAKVTDIALCSIVVYELRHGAESSSDPARDHAKLDVFLAPFSSLSSMTPAP